MRLEIANRKFSDNLSHGKAFDENSGKCLSRPLQEPEEDLDDSFEATYYSEYETKKRFDEDRRDDFQDDVERTPNALPPRKKYALDPYNRLPEGPRDEPFAYVEKTVRKKAERAKLHGFECKECRPWYDQMNLGTAERVKLINRCSKHRGKFKPKECEPQTPESFWNPLISPFGSDDESQ